MLPTRLLRPRPIVTGVAAKVSPSDYDRFFEALRSDELDRFVSSLQAALKAHTNGARPSA